MSYYPVRELQMVDTGTRVDFASTNILDSGYTDIKTLTVAVKKLDIVHNGGGQIIIRKNGADVGFIAPGYKGLIDFSGAIGDIIRFKSVSGTIDTGLIFLNYLG